MISVESNVRMKEQVKIPAWQERDRLVWLWVLSALLFDEDQKGSKDACLEEETDESSRAEAHHKDEDAHSLCCNVLVPFDPAHRAISVSETAILI